MKDLIPTYLINSSSNQSTPFTEQNGDDDIDEQLDFEYVPLFDQIIAEEDLYRKMINFQYSHFKSYYTYVKNQN